MPAPADKTAASSTALAAAAYFKFDAILASVTSGAVAAVRGSYIVALHKQGGRIVRRQDLPRHAFWDPAALVSLLQKIKETFGADADQRFGELCVALSYRWLMAGMPDPDGHHLASVALVAKPYLAYLAANTFKPLGIDSGEADFAIFWDFMSLYQQPGRTDEESALFVAGLKASNIWYGHTHTMMWMQPKQPDGFSFPSHLAATYEESGWCFVEASLSALLKPRTLRLDLSKVAYGAAKWRSVLNGIGGQGCVAGRSPPMLPETVRALLLETKKFTSKADAPTVADLYERFFTVAAPALTSTDLSGLRWGDAETISLAKVVPSFTSCRSINLSDNSIGHGGIAVLAGSLLVNESLSFVTLDGFALPVKQLKGTEPTKTIDLSSKRLGVASGMVIAKLIEVNAALTKLDVSYNLLGPEGGAAIADALKVNAALTKLDVRYNGILGEGAQQLAAAALDSKSLEVFSSVPIKELREDKLTELELVSQGLGPTEGIVLAGLLKGSAVLTNLNLASNQLCGLDEYGNGTYDPSGIKALASAISVNAVLTTLDLSSNGIGSEGANAIAEALKVNAVLKSINLQYNSLDKEKERAVQESVKGREGFDLRL